MVIASVKFYKIEGHWTPGGKLYYERWNNFKKYLTDFSEHNEHPLESVKLDNFIVYATALGVSKEVIHNMYLIVPSEIQKMSNFYLDNQIYITFDFGFRNAYASSAPSGSSVIGGSSGGGGGGGIGGGFGGGGGGAF